MFLFRSPESLIADLTRQVDFYLRIASAADGTRQPLNDGADQFNEWVRLEGGRLETEKADLNRLKAAIEEGKRRLQSGGGRAALEVLIAEWNGKLPEYNARVEAFNKTSVLRRKAVENSRKSMSRSVKQCQRWLNHDGPLKLSTNVNRLFGRLLVRRRAKPVEAARLNPWLAQLRSLRARLASHTIQNQSLSASGMLVVPARLENEAGESEECWFMVDNGCGTSMFSPEIVHAMCLDFDNRAKIRLRLANGVSIKAPPCAAPGVTVNGSKALFIKGIVLRETTPGLDGVLGMSFLSRFDFSIQKAAPQRLVLQTASWTAGRGEFDVFICFKTEDLQYARLVYTQLTQRGYRPFFSPVSVPGSHNTEFSVPIDQAIESARHMIVVCSNASYVMSTYVMAEWRLFEGLRRTGRKSGNIVPVLFDGMTPNKLPSALSVFHSIMAAGSAEEWIGQLTGFLPRR